MPVYADVGAGLAPASKGRLQESPLQLPEPGTMVHLSPPLNPPILKGIKVHPDNPFRFDFILDTGYGSVDDAHNLTEESNRLIRYFLASLTVPEKDLWVNLSPYEKNRIVPESFGQTEMGRDLLAQDYMLKQVTATLIYPEEAMGQSFWKRIYQEAAKRYGTTNIPFNTFNKVWIVPEKAGMYTKNNTAFVVEARLKVMLEEDYLAMDKNIVGATPRGRPLQRQAQGPAPTESNKIGSQIIREIIIPALEKEVNEGANFAQLRQVYNSLILATWYKKKIKDSILVRMYVDKNKIVGVGSKPTQSQRAGPPVRQAGLEPASTDIELIYQRYLQAFKKGVYNYIKEEPDLITQKPIPRKYFSGGAQFGQVSHLLDENRPISEVRVAQAILAQVNFQPIIDKAMQAKPTLENFHSTFEKLAAKVSLQLISSEFKTKEVGPDGNLSWGKSGTGVKIIEYENKNNIFQGRPSYSFDSSKGGGLIVVINKGIDPKLRGEVIKYEVIKRTVKAKFPDLDELLQEDIATAAHTQTFGSQKKLRLIDIDSYSKLLTLEQLNLLKEGYENEKIQQRVRFKNFPVKVKDYIDIDFDAVDEYDKMLYEYITQLIQQKTSHPKEHNGPIAHVQGAQGIDWSKAEVFKDFKHTEPLLKADISPDGTKIMTVYEGGAIKIRDIATGQGLVKIDNNKEWRHAQFSKDGTKIVTANAAGEIVIWNTKTYKPMRRFKDLPFLGTLNIIHAVSFSPDGTKVVIATDDGYAIILDAMTGEMKVKLDHYEVIDAQFSSDGTKVVTVNPSIVIIWDAITGDKLVRIEEDKGEIFSASFSPDGTTVVTASDDHVARIFDVQTGKEMQKFKGHTKDVRNANFSPDGTKVVTASSDQTVRIWDVSTGQEIGTLEGHLDSVWTARFSADGTKILTASQDGTAKIWEAPIAEKVNTEIKSPQALALDWSKGALVREIHPGEEVSYPLRSSGVSTDGTIIFSQNGAGKVRLWDQSTGEEIKIEGSIAGYASIHQPGTALSAKNDILTISPNRKNIILWSKEGIPLRESFPLKENILTIAMSKDGSRILGLNDENTVSIWEPEGDKSFKKKLSLKTGGFKEITAIAISADGKYAAIGGKGFGKGEEKVCIYDLAKPSQNKFFDLEGEVSSLAISGDGRYTVIGSQQRDVKVFDRDLDRLRELPPDGVNIMTHVAISENGKYMATTHNHTTVKLWDTQTFNEINSFTTGDGLIVNLSLSKDGKILTATDAHKNAVYVFEAGEASDFNFDFNFDWSKAVETKEEFNRPIKTFAVSPDGKLLAVAFNTEILVVDAQTYEKKYILRSNDNHPFIDVSSMAFSPDGKQIVTGHPLGFAYYWNANSGMFISTVIKESLRRDILENSSNDEDNQIRSILYSSAGKLVFKAGNKVYFGYGNGHFFYSIFPENINSVTLSPDGQRVVVVTVNGAYVGSVKKAEFHMITDYPQYSPQFSPDGTRLALAYSSGTYILDAQTFKIVEKIKEGSILAYSPDGYYMAIEMRGTGGLIGIYDVVRRKIVKSCLNKFVYDKQPVVFSPYGHQLMGLGGISELKILTVPDAHKNAVHVFEAADLKSKAGTINWANAGDAYKSFEGKNITRYTISPDGRKVAVILNNQEIKILNALSLKELFSFENKGDHTFNRAYALDFTPDGKFLKTGHEAGQVFEWNAENGEFKSRIRNVFDEVNSPPVDLIAHSPDGRDVAIGMRQYINVWATKEGKFIGGLSGIKERLALQFKNSPVSWAFSEDGTYITTLTDWGSIYLLRRSDGRHVYYQWLEDIDPSRSFISFESNSRIAVSSPGKLNYVDIINEELSIHPTPSVDHQVFYSPDKKVRVIQSSNLIHVSEHQGAFVPIPIEVESSIYTVASVGNDGTILLIDHTNNTLRVISPQQALQSSKVEGLKNNPPKQPSLALASQDIFQSRSLEFDANSKSISIVNYEILPPDTKPRTNKKANELMKSMQEFEDLNSKVIALLHKEERTLGETNDMFHLFEQMIQLYLYLYKQQKKDVLLDNVAQSDKDLAGGKNIARIFLMIKEEYQRGLKSAKHKSLTVEHVLPEDIAKELGRYDMDKTKKLIYEKGAEQYSEKEMKAISFAELINIVHQKAHKNPIDVKGQDLGEEQIVKVKIGQAASDLNLSLNMDIGYIDARERPSQKMPLAMVYAAQAFAKGQLIHQNRQLRNKGTSFDTKIDIFSDDQFLFILFKIGMHSAYIQFDLRPPKDGGRIYIHYTDSGPEGDPKVPGNPGYRIRFEALIKAFRAVGFEVNPQGYSFDAKFDKDSGASFISELPEKLMFTIQAITSTLDLDLLINRSELKSASDSIDFLAQRFIADGYLNRGGSKTAAVSKQSITNEPPLETIKWIEAVEALLKPLGFDFSSYPNGQRKLDQMMKAFDLARARGALIKDKELDVINRPYLEASKQSPISIMLKDLENLEPETGTDIAHQKIALIAQNLEEFGSQRPIGVMGGFQVVELKVPTLTDTIIFYLIKDLQMKKFVWGMAVLGEFFFDSPRHDTFRNKKLLNNKLTVDDLDEILSPQGMGRLAKTDNLYLSIPTVAKGPDYEKIPFTIELLARVQYPQLFPPFERNKLTEVTSGDDQVSDISLGGTSMNRGVTLGRAVINDSQKLPPDFKGGIFIATLADTDDDPKTKASNGLVLTSGSTNSHGASRARADNIPGLILLAAAIKEQTLVFRAAKGHKIHKDYTLKGKKVITYELSNYQQEDIVINNGDILYLDGDTGYLYVLLQNPSEGIQKSFNQYHGFKTKQKRTKEELQSILMSIDNTNLLKAIINDVNYHSLISEEDMEEIITSLLAQKPELKESLNPFLQAQAIKGIEDFQKNSKDAQELLEDQTSSMEQIFIKMTALYHQAKRLSGHIKMANGHWQSDWTIDRIQGALNELWHSARNRLSAHQKELIDIANKYTLRTTSKLRNLSRIQRKMDSVGLNLKDIRPDMSDRLEQLIEGRKIEVEKKQGRGIIWKKDLKDRYARAVAGGKGAHAGEIVDINTIIMSGESFGLEGKSPVAPEGFVIQPFEHSLWNDQGKPKALDNELRNALTMGYRDLVIHQSKALIDFLDKDTRSKDVKVKAALKDILDDYYLIENVVRPEHIQKYVDAKRNLINHILETNQDNLSKSLKNRLAVFGAVAVRSSDLDEDTQKEAKAGKYKTQLNARNLPQLFEGVLSVWKSGARAVLVEEMINAKLSFTGYSVNPVDKDVNHIRIVACHGLNKGVVDGIVEDPDEYIVDRRTWDIVKKHIGQKSEMVVLDVAKGDTIKVDNPQAGQQALNDEQIVQAAKTIDAYAQVFGFEIDHEASFDTDDRLVTLQVRPETTIKDVIADGLRILNRDQPKEIMDSAMATSSAKDVGGIDLDPSQLTIEESGQDIVMNGFEEFKDMPIEGFVPIIINLTPIKDLNIFLQT